MTARDEPFERTLRSWMTDEGSADGALEVHAAAIAAVRQRRQRPTWIVAVRGTTWDGARTTRGFPSPRLLILLATLVAATIGIGIVGSGAFRSDRGLLVLPPAASPGPSTSSVPTPAPRATPRVDLPAPLPSRPPFSEMIVAYLAAHGQSVTPVPGAVTDTDVDEALRDVRPQGLGATRYYALVTCVDPPKGCAEVGSTGPGDERGIWFIYGQYVRAVDAVTLEQILINGY